MNFGIRKPYPLSLFIWSSLFHLGDAKEGYLETLEVGSRSPGLVRVALICPVNSEADTVVGGALTLEQAGQGLHPGLITE